MKNIPALFTMLAAIVIALIVFVEVRGPAKEADIRTEERNKVKNETKLELDSLRREHENTRRTLDSLNALVDSVRRDNEKLSSESLKKAQQIKALKGKYKNVPQDSLGRIMDERAERNGSR